MTTVLLIDDDAQLGELLAEYCAAFSIDLVQSLRPSEGLSLLDNTRFDAVILDVMLPEMDGFEVMRQIRRTHDLPVLMLSARGEVTDRIVGLELGANDYLAKPFEPRELVARLQGNIKRHHRGDGSQVDDHSPDLHYSGLSIFPTLREVHVDGEPKPLTTMEYALLTLLANQPGEAFSRDRILAELKGTDNELYSRSVDILVSRLRSKLKPSQPIRTIHGAGYAFVAPRLGSA